MDSRTHSGPSPSTNNTHFMVPRAPNALFAGREGVIKRIIQSLSPSNQLNKQKRFVITGLGGQGKSELSIKIADLLREEYWGIFWIDVDNELSAKQGFLAVAKQLNPVAESVADALLALTNVKNHWLLILDNADDPDFDYQAYFPSGTYGSILMTSRVTECSRFNTVGSIALAGLQLDQCIPLLLNAAELPQDQWSSHYRDAKDIVQHLGSHTLAIIQAGAYLARGFCKFNEYIQDFQRQRGLLLKYRQRQATSRYGDVYATFEASAARLEQMGTDASRDALELLNIISVLHYTPLSIELFDKAWECTHKLLVMGILNSRASPEAFEDDDDAQYIKSFWHFPGQLKKKESLDKWHFLHLPEFINNGDEDYKPRRLLNAISLLDSLSLIKNNHFLSVSMHPLAHAWAKDRQSRQSQFKSWMTAGCILAVSTTNSQLESFWETRGDQLVTHLSSYLDSNTDNQISSQSAPRVIPILLQCGRALDLMDDYNGLEQVCRTLQNQHGIDPSHSSVDFVEVYELIASMYMNQHRSVKAIHALKVILHLRTTVYNNTGYTLLYSVSKLASALRRKGDFSEAIALLDYYIAQSKTRLPATDPNLLRLQSVLATLYERTGQASKAIKLLKKVIAIQTTIFTFDDPILFESQHNLAIAYYQDTQFTKAIKLLEYLTTVQMPIFREDHPSRLLTEKMLAKAYLITGRFESALKILERVVLMQERTLSVHHPNLLGSQHALAKAYLETGQVLIAIQILEIVVAMRRKIYREDNPERLASQIYLARAYGRDGQIKRAVKLLKQLAHIRATEETALLDYDDQLSAAEELTYWSKQLERRSSVEDLVYRSGQLELDSD
ncbi:hypothetical protein B0J11DRAFT_449159 [Dendryphion nanum]|uniref:NB-ARC domain-containing protein n=1 Tax=Dendryphion nanum TaxID=256645 RepID=A0A9P9CYA8_9PLEO|nr:hypothetical protein B0J11DRAFT_449159 [Dendryphion nanum]